MSVKLLSYARISRDGILLADRGPEGARGFSEPWSAIDPDLRDKIGMPPLKGRYFSKAPSARFGRMDALCKLALGAAELCVPLTVDVTRQDVALVGASMLGCLEVDAQYHDTLLKGGPAGASPALYVYTLPSMFLGEIAIKFGFRGRTSFINSGRQSAVSALANGVRLIEKGRALVALVVAAEAVGSASCELDLDARGISGACAWLLAAEGQGLCSLGNVRYGSSEGEPLAEGPDGNGLTYVSTLQQELLGNSDQTLRCGEGANAITMDVTAT